MTNYAKTISATAGPRTHKLRAALFTLTLLASTTPALADETDPHAAAAAPAPGQVVRIESEVPGQYYYDGQVAALGRTRIQHFACGRREVLFDRDGELPRHDGNTAIYASTFDLETRASVNEVGGHIFCGDLTDGQKLRGYEEGSMVYSDGEGGYFLPTVTQELWEREGRRVGAFVASYNIASRLRLTPGAHLPDGGLPQGLYNIKTLSEGAEREETWCCMGTDEEYVVTSPLNAPSIPGMDHPVCFVGAEPTAEVQEAQTKLRHIRQPRGGNQGLPENVPAIFIAGPSGAGKSTIAQVLARKVLVAEDGDAGLQLRAEDPVPVFQIGHGLNQRGTREPGLWYDEERGHILGDLPGFGDPAGGGNDMKHALLLRALFENNWNAKIIFVLSELQVMTRGSNVLRAAVTDLVRTFSSDEKLHQNLTFLVTGQGRLRNVQTFLRNQAAQIRGLVQQGELQMEERAIALLEFLRDNPERIVTMSYPDDIGAYDSDEFLENLETTLGQAHATPLGRDDVLLNIGDAGRHLALQWGMDLVRFIGDWVRTEGSRKLVHHCTQLVESGGVNLADLRTTLRTLVAETRALVGLEVEALTSFLQGLEGIYGQGVLNDSRIVDAVHDLGFLKGLNQGITYNVQNWVTGFEPGLQRVETLAADPVVTQEGGILTFKGALLGLAEMVQAYNGRAGVARVDGLATYKLFIDGNFAAPGVSLSLIAPMWDVRGGPRTINLNGTGGRNGAPGANGAAGHPGGAGQPGAAGGNGGSFFGKGHTFDNINHLTVTTAGGRGGNGGNGGTGGAGANGRNGNLSIVTKEGWHRTKHHRRAQNEYFRDRGTDGVQGARGGNAARGGLGGAAGTNELVGTPWQPNIVQGANGNNGQAGNGGAGGVHGRHCQGHDWVTHTTRGGKSRGVRHREVRQAHGLQAPRGSANNGANGALSATPAAAPAPLVDIEGNARVDTYRVFKEDDAVAGYVQKVFPGLY